MHAQLPQPLALLEVGAAAGLCLLPDRYGYDYGRVRVGPAFPHDAATPVFRCRAAPATPLPEHNISVVWRAGLDLAPVDLRDESQDFLISVDGHPVAWADGHGTWIDWR